MFSDCLLTDLTPSGSALQWAEVLGFEVRSEHDLSLKSQLMAFGILPGVRIACEAALPLTKSRIYHFDSWRGVLRENEASLVRVRRLTGPL